MSTFFKIFGKIPYSKRADVRGKMDKMRGDSGQFTSFWSSVPITPPFGHNYHPQALDHCFYFAR